MPATGVLKNAGNMKLNTVNDAPRLVGNARMNAERWLLHKVLRYICG